MIKHFTARAVTAFLLAAVPTLAGAQQQRVNIGASPNNGGGDTLRSAFGKLNNNDADLYGRLSALNPILQNVPTIAPDGTVSMSSGLVFGKYTNGQFTSQPYAIQIGSGGASGPVDGASVTPSGSAGSNTLAKLLYGAVPADGPATPSSQLATAAWVRSFGSGYANALSCLNPAQLFDVLGGIGAIDLTSTLQSCFNNLGAVSVLFPGGKYQIAGTLTPPPGQNWIGVGRGWNNGSIIYVPPSTTVPTFKLTTGGAVRGFAFQASSTAPDGQYLIYINNASTSVIEDNFFSGGFAQIYADGTSFYTQIDHNTFYGGAVYQLRINSSTNPGIDLIARGNRFLNSTADRTISAWRMTGLGSAIMSDNQLSTGATSGALCWFEGVAPLYGGLQFSNNVCEQASGSGQAAYFQGTSSAPFKHVFGTNNLFTGNTGPAIQADFTDKFSLTGGAVASLSTNGPIQFGAGGSNTNFGLSSLTLEGSAGVSPVQALGAGSGSITMRGVTWTGSAPIVTLGTMSGLSSFEFIGGNPGTATSPFGLPSSTKAIISYQGASAYRGGKLGVGTLAPGNLVTFTGTNLDYTAPVSGNATMRVTTGSGSILDPGLSFGNNATEGWIQAVQPGSNVMPLRLNGSGGGALIGKPPTGLTDTTGLSYVPAYAGTPTAAPSAFTGYAPIAVDTTNGKICSYVASAWKCATLQ